MQAEYIQIGEIVKPQGIRGEVKLRAMTSDMGRYARLETVYLRRGGAYEAARVEKGRANGGFAFLKLEGVNSRDDAEALRGVAVYVDRAHAIEGQTALLDRIRPGLPDDDGIEHDHIFALVVKGDDALVDADHIRRHAHAAIFVGGQRIQQVLRRAEIVCRGGFRLLGKKDLVFA